MRFEDRPEAGRRPAARLADLLAGEPAVLAITASGVTVAHEIAQRLFAPLDVLLVERLRAPDDVRLFPGMFVWRYTCSQLSMPGGHR